MNVDLHRVLRNKKNVCKEGLELLTEQADESDVANIADWMWCLYIVFGNPMQWSQPLLDALSPFMEYAVTNSADKVYLQRDSYRMHALDYLREFHLVSKFTHMINGARGIMHDVVLIDSGSSFHCTGDRSLISDDYTEVPPGYYINAASGTGMRVHGIGSIHNDKFQVQEVLYVPDLNQPNINKTIISVRKLTALGYNVNFGATTCPVIDERKRTWTGKYEIVGEGHVEHGLYMLDYLRIPNDRAPAPTSSEGPGLVKSLWNAAVTGWSRITERLSQRATGQRPPV